MKEFKDTFEKFEERGELGRGRFGDHEQAPLRRGRGPRVTGASNLCDVDVFLRNDNPAKQAIGVSVRADTPFAEWKWLPRSLVEFEPAHVGAQISVAMPQRLALEKGLI